MNALQLEVCFKKHAPCTQLLQELFGDEIGLPTRSAIGVNVLPGNIPVEIEVLVSYK